MQRIFVLHFLQDEHIGAAGHHLPYDLRDGVHADIEELCIPFSLCGIELGVFVTVMHVVEEVFHVVAHDREARRR